LGGLIQIARRARGLTVEKLAEVTNVSLGDLVASEDDAGVVPDERAVTQLAAALGLSAHKVLEIAGLREPSEAGLTDAAIRFKARCEPTAKFSQAEEQALRELSQVLAETPGKT
jgi:transcriptional regulator with XRE-family HTH domain